MELQTSKTTTKLNFNDLAFLTSKSTSEAKWDIAGKIYTPDQLDEYDHKNECYKYLTKSGTPKISVNEFVDKSDFETKIKSCSILDGLNSIDYIIDTYNKGITLDRLRVYSENEAFQKALKFTGKFTILNSILNKDQYLKLQRTWLIKNTYMVKYWTDKCKNFIKDNNWTVKFLVVNMISEDMINQQMKD